MTSRVMSSGLQRVPSRPTCRSSNRRAFTWGSISRRRLHLAFLYRMCLSLGPTRSANETPRIHHAARRRGGRVAARGARAADGVYRIGYLGVTSSAGYAREIEALLSGLRRLGYEEGKNIAIVY